MSELMAPRFGQTQALPLAVAASHNGTPPACVLSNVTFDRVNAVANVLAVSLKVICRSADIAEINQCIRREILRSISVAFFVHSRFGLQGAVVVAERPFRASGFQAMSPRMYCHKP